MTLRQVVFIAMTGAALAASLGAVYPWWVVLVAEVLVAGVSAAATYTHHTATQPEVVPLSPFVVPDAQHRTPYNLSRRFGDAPIGLCEIDTDGVIRHIEGGALRMVGTDPSAWNDQLLTEPWISQGYLPAMEGRTVIFEAPDPVQGERQQLIMYSPAYNRGGRICGATVWWILVPPGQRVEVTSG